MERTSKGLYDFLCGQMEKLAAKKSTVEELKAQAASAKQLNNILMYELNRAKFLDKSPKAMIRDVESP